MSSFKTRAEIGAKVNTPPHSYYSVAMKEIFKHREEVKTVGFHSDVYYVRAALEKHTGLLIPLPAVDKAMRDEGWYEGVVNRRRK
jgi:hypothetical protein